MERASDREILEVFAFELAYLQFTVPEGSPDPRAAFLESWQTTESVRRQAYEQAQHFMQELVPQGLDIRACNSKHVRDAIQVIVTIPARTAYQLPPTAVVDPAPIPPPVPSPDSRPFGGMSR